MNPSSLAVALSPDFLPPQAARRPASQVLTSWVLGVYALCAWILLLTLPAAPMITTLDNGWQAVLHYAAAHHWRYGIDMVVTFGPLGHLQCAGQYHAETFVGCIVYQMLSRAYYVGLLVYLTRGLGRLAAVAFLLTNTLLPLLDEDSFYLLAIGYSGLVLQRDVRTGRPWLLPAVVFLATAALMKETFLAYGGFTLVCAAVSLGASGRWRTGALVLGGFAVCFLVADWWPGDQDWRDLPAFLRHGWEVVRGHPAAMATPPTNLPFVTGCALLLVLVGWRLARAAFFCGGEPPARAEHIRRAAIFLMACAGLFLAWKIGFTRADPSHGLTFFSCAVAIGAAVPVFFPNRAPFAGSAWYLEMAFYAVPLLVVWTILRDPSWIVRERTPLAQRVEANLRWLLTPDQQHARLDAQAQAAAAGRALPRCRAAVGSASVDLFGCAQSVLLDNGYNYRPPPIFQPYFAYTADLLALNAAFYQSERAPEFVIFKPAAIDKRYPNLENAPVLTWLLRCYQPILAERGALLLRREPDPGPAEPLRPLAEGDLTPGAELVVPPGEGPIWCEIDWRPTLLGRLAGLLFQPPYCQLDVFAPGKVAATRYRLIPEMARSGFLLSPTVATAEDFLRTLAGRDQPQRPRAVAIVADRSSRWLMGSTARFRLYQVPPFASPEEAARIGALLPPTPAAPTAPPS